MNSSKDKYKETIEVYKKLGLGYIQSVAKVIPYGFKEFVEILSRESRVLDVGCAGGRDSKRLVQKGFEVIGIDLVDEFLEEARKYVPEARFINMDLLKLEFPENYFDAIYACAVLLHVKKKDIPRALEGFYNILKPSGKLYIAVKEGKGIEYKRDKLSDKQKRMFTYFREDELRRFLKKAGFEMTLAKVFLDPLGRKDVNWLVVFADKRYDKSGGSFKMSKKNKSKNLKEAQERFKKACKDKNHKEIAIASAETLIHDKKKMKEMTESFIQGRKLLEFIKKTVKPQELEKLTRRQIRSLVIKKWKEIKRRDNIELSKEAERITIKAMTSVFHTTTKNQEKLKEKKNKKS